MKTATQINRLCEFHRALNILDEETLRSDRLLCGTPKQAEIIVNLRQSFESMIEAFEKGI